MFRRPKLVATIFSFLASSSFRSFPPLILSLPIRFASFVSITIRSFVLCVSAVCLSELANVLVVSYAHLPPAPRIPPSCHSSSFSTNVHCLFSSSSLLFRAFCRFPTQQSIRSSCSCTTIQNDRDRNPLLPLFSSLSATLTMRVCFSFIRTYHVISSLSTYRILKI